MRSQMEKILKDLVYVDNLALEVNEKKKNDLSNINNNYEEEIKKLVEKLEEERAKENKYMENTIKEAEDEALEIKENMKKTIEVLENKYQTVKSDILNKTINQLFGLETDKI